MCRSATQLLSLVFMLAACGSSGDVQPAATAKGKSVEQAAQSAPPTKGAANGAPIVEAPQAGGPEAPTPAKGDAGETVPKLEVEAATEPAPTAKDWWCLCYARSVGDGQEPLTACRSSQSECTKLQRRVAKGGRGIVAKSLRHGCALVSAVHPGDVLGTPEAWSPSRRPGAWLSTGACLFSDDDGADVGDDAGDDDDADVNAFEEAGMEVLSKTEFIGPLKLGMTTKEALQAVGEPATKDEREEEPATGDFLEIWHYPEGLTLIFKASAADSPLHIGGISIEPPSKLKTARGVGLGTSRDEVKRIYADVVPEDDETMSDVIVLGSYYWGMFLGFEGSGVATIYFGDGAE